MGNITKIIDKVDLGESKFRPEEDKWCLPFHIELREDIHIHWQDIRIEMNTDDFENFAISINKAYEKWKSLGKPKVSEDCIYLGDWNGEEEFDFRFDRDKKYTKDGKLRHHFRAFPRTERDIIIEDNACQLELQVNGQYHLHYKNFRLELGPKITKQIAEIFKKI